MIKLYDKAQDYGSKKPHAVFPLKAGGEVGLRFASSLNDNYFVVCQVPKGIPPLLRKGERVEMSQLDRLVDFNALYKQGVVPDNLAKQLVEAGLLTIPKN